MVLRLVNVWCLSLMINLPSLPGAHPQSRGRSAVFSVILFARYIPSRPNRGSLLDCYYLRGMHSVCVLVLLRKCNDLQAGNVLSSRY